MKTFEEIFDSVEREMKEEEKRKKEEALKAQQRQELENKIIKAYQYFDDMRDYLNNTKKVNEFIEKEKVMDAIFEKFLNQVKRGQKELIFKKRIEDDLILANVLKDCIIARLERELPSYDITVDFDFDLGIFEKGYYIKISVKKLGWKPKQSKPTAVKQEIPYVIIEEFDDETRDLVAQFIFELLETIPQLDEKELSFFKEIGLVREYQPYQVGNKSFNRPAKPQIISVRLFSSADYEVFEKVKSLCINNTPIHYEWEFSTCHDNKVTYVNSLRSGGLEALN